MKRTPLKRSKPINWERAMKAAEALADAVEYYGSDVSPLPKSSPSWVDYFSSDLEAFRDATRKP